MRSLSLVLLALFGLCAYAQEEGELVRPKLRLPGEKVYRDFALTPADLQGLDPTDEGAIKEKLKSLNEERAQLKEKLGKAIEKATAAQQELNQVLAQLDQQDAAFVQYLTQKMGAEKGKEFAIRLQLQPVIDWLALDADKAKALIAKQLDLIEIVDVQRQIAEQARAAAAGQMPKTAEERLAKITLLKKYADLNRTWIANIRTVIADDPEKTKQFELRYRRTRYDLDVKPMELKPEPPKAEAPKEEAPKEEAPKEDAPKADAPKEDAPKAEAPKAEAPKEEKEKEEEK
jgi:hypothetical protein